MSLATSALHAPNVSNTLTFDDANIHIFLNMQDKTLFFLLMATTRERPERHPAKTTSIGKRAEANEAPATHTRREKPQPHTRDEGSPHPDCVGARRGVGAVAFAHPERATTKSKETPPRGDGDQAKRNVTQRKRTEHPPSPTRHRPTKTPRPSQKKGRRTANAPPPGARRSQPRRG